MTILKKIGLSKMYGKAIYAISAVLTLAISSLVFFNPYAIPMAILLKLLSIPIIMYLYTTLPKKTYIKYNTQKRLHSKCLPLPLKTDPSSQQEKKSWKPTKSAMPGSFLS